MARRNQKNVTLPAWVWELVTAEFESKKEYYARLGVKSPTKLVQIWLLQHLDLKP
jgi:hypothetical protein